MSALSLRLACVATSVVLCLGNAPCARAADASLNSGPALAVAARGQSRAVDFRLVGTYEPDGLFRRAPRRLLRQTYAHDTLQQVVNPAAIAVPYGMRVRPAGTVLENYQPPRAARALPESRSVLSSAAETLATRVFGHKPVLIAPLDLATDSRGRVIVSDRAAGCVHMLGGPAPLRLAAGRGRRLLAPSGIAVDADDNIYIADAELGLVQVYSRDGVFQRSLGSFDDEAIFERPAGVAVDAADGSVFVADPPANEIVVLSVDGRVRKRLGGRRDPERFLAPTEVAVHRDFIAVVDDSASRLHIFNRQFESQATVRLRPPSIEGPVSSSGGSAEVGLAIDAEGYIYVSSQGSSVLRIYTRTGQLVHATGTLAADAGGVASAVWVDAAGRVYLSDARARRIAVLERVQRTDGKSGEAAAHAN